MIPAYVTFFLALMALIFGIFLGCMFEAQLLGRWDEWKIKRSERFKRERDDAMVRYQASEDRVRYLEDRYDLNGGRHGVYVEGGYLPVVEPEQHRPVQRG